MEGHRGAKHATSNGQTPAAGKGDPLWLVFARGSRSAKGVAKEEGQVVDVLACP